MPPEIIYGRNAVTEAFKSTIAQTKVQRLLLAEGVDEKPGTPVANLLELATRQRPAVAIRRVSRQELDRLTKQANHQGVVAEVNQYGYFLFEELVEIAENEPQALLLALDSVQDPQNLGTLFRTAEAVGVTGIILPERRSAGVTAAVRNASSGAVEHLRIAQVVNLARALQQLKQAGVWVAGLEDEPKAVTYYKADLTGRLALVVGSEGEGLGRLIREKCDYFMVLPMLGKVASLNAATAGSVALYEVLRQRQAGSV